MQLPLQLYALLSNIVLISLFSQSLCMEISRDIHVAECKKINAKNAQKLDKFLENACTTDPAQKIQEIEQSLAQLQSAVDQQTTDLLQTVQHSYNIPDALWDRCTMINTSLQLHETVGTNIDLLNITHDTRLPADFFLMLKKNFENNDINPNRINVFVVEGAYAAVTPAVPDWTFECNNLTITTGTPGSITLGSQIFAELSSYKKKEELAIALTSGLAMTILNMPDIIKNICNISITEHDLCHFHYSQKTFLTLHAALKNGHSAHVLKKFYRCTDPSIMSLNDYKYLNRIDRLHKALAWLKKYTTPTIPQQITNDTTETKEPEKNAQ